MFLSHNGNLGIGSLTPRSKLHLSGSTAAKSGIRQSRDGVKIWTQEIDSNGKLQWAYRSTEAGSATQAFTINDTGQIIFNEYGSGTYTVITDNSSNWNTAFGWGNHASAGYLTGTLPTLGNDTNNVIEFNNSIDNEINTQKKRNFWNLLKFNE